MNCPDFARIINDICFFNEGQLSQSWSNHSFFYNTLNFNSSEQFMMCMKAILFDDIETAEQIKTTADSIKQRQLGRQIKNFSENIWSKHKQQIVFFGNLLKFSQNPELLRYLKCAKKFVKVSKDDLIWGTNLDLDQIDTSIKWNSWEGENLLGKNLSIVKAALLKK
jgi:ribA/ribD-fused uncharacterized protein